MGETHQMVVFNPSESASCTKLFWTIYTVHEMGDRRFFVALWAASTLK